MDVRLEQLATAYWRHYELSRSRARADRLESSDYFWAWEVVDEAMRSADEGAVAIICELVNTAPDDGGLAHVGAGPLEDLLCGHGRAFLGQIEEAARRDQRFRSALASVWDRDPDPEVLSRLGRYGFRRLTSE